MTLVCDNGSLPETENANEVHTLHKQVAQLSLQSDYFLQLRAGCHIITGRER